MTQAKRCPTCLNIMPLTRRKCPYCNRELSTDVNPLSLDLLSLQETLAGKFEIISELHRSSQTSIYMAQDLILDRKVALKTLKFEENLPDNVVDKWKQNLKRSQRINAPYITQVYTYGQVGSILYVILELVTDSTLQDLLSDEEHLPIWKCLRIGRDIARALHAAHNIGICHHRLTPSNIVVSRDGTSRLLDLGSAHGTIEALQKKPWSVNSASSRYFAPEQIETGISEPLSDQYRLGAILYRILANQSPYDETGEYGAVERLQKNPKNIRGLNGGVPEELETIVRKTLAINPMDRYEDCHKLELALESLDPDLWLPDIEPAFQSPTPQATVALLLDEAIRNEKNREYERAVSLCEQALVLAPYNTEVTSTLLRVQQLLEQSLEVDAQINRALNAFYSNQLDDALKILNAGKKIDRDNAEIMKLTHEILQEQERHRLIAALLDAARIDIAKQALSSAMSSVVRILDIDPGNADAIKLKQKIEFGMEDRATLGIMVARAESAFTSNRIEEAEALLVKITRIDPDNFHAKKLSDKIDKLKKHRRLRELWEQFDQMIRDEEYRPAIDVLKQISVLDPALKPDIRTHLIRIREKLAEQQSEDLAGETRPLRPVKAQDLKQNQSPPQQPTPLPVSHPETNTAKPVSNLSDKPNATPQESSAAISVNDSGNLSEPIPPVENDTVQVESVTDEINLETFAAMIRNPQKRRALLKYSGAGIVVIALLLLFFNVVNRITHQSQSSFSDQAPAVIKTEPTATPTSTPEPTQPPTATPRPTATMTPVVIPTEKPTARVNSELVTSLLKSADSNERNGNHLMAVALYRQALKEDRSNPVALKGLQRAQARVEQEKRVSKQSTETSRNRSPEPTVSSAESKTDGLSLIPNRVKCYPDTPSPGRDLKVAIELTAADSSKLKHLWLFYRKPGDLGFSQAYASRAEQVFFVTIPGDEILENHIQYFLNGLDSASREYFFGSPETPKRLP